MKTIDTLRFGQIEYKEEEVLTFKKGLPGFENEQQFIFIQTDPQDPFAFLQSVQTSELSFIIANPFSFYPDYEFDLEQQSKDELEIHKTEDVTVWGILSIPEDFQKATINLKAPVIINISKRKGKQVILHETTYEIRTPIFNQKIKEGVK